MANEISVLEVRLHDARIGTITHLPGDQTLFAFDEAYLADPERPTLSLSYKDASGGVIADLRPVQTRLPPFFSNLLPEGPLRTYLAERAGVKEIREFPLLGVLGDDLPGAVTVQPLELGRWPALGGEDGDEEDRIAPMRFSLAGVQLKFSAIMESAGGLTIPASGAGGDWIVKLPSPSYAGVPENEFAMMTLARLADISVPEFTLVSVSDIDGLPRGVEAVGGDAFVVRRFDRPAGGARAHMEDFAQIFAVYPDRKYEQASYRNIAEVILSEVGVDGVVDFVRRLVFNALIGNADMHLKNWSLIYPDGRRAALAPAYDFVSTIVYIDDDKMALNFNGSSTKPFRKLSIPAFKRFADKARLPQKPILDAVEGMLVRFDEVWRSEKPHLTLPKAALDVIEKHRAEVFAE